MVGVDAASAVRPCLTALAGTAGRPSRRRTRRRELVDLGSLRTRAAPSVSLPLGGYAVVAVPHCRSVFARLRHCHRRIQAANRRGAVADDGDYRGLGGERLGR